MSPSHRLALSFSLGLLIGLAPSAWQWARSPAPDAPRRHGDLTLSRLRLLLAARDGQEEGPTFAVDELLDREPGYRELSRGKPLDREVVRRMIATLGQSDLTLAEAAARLGSE